MARRRKSEANPAETNAEALEGAKVVRIPSKKVDPDAVEAKVMLRARDLVERVAASCPDVKKAHLRSVIDATLSELSNALQRQEMINLPQFGKAKVQRVKQTGDAPVSLVRVQFATGDKEGAKPLAKAED